MTSPVYLLSGEAFLAAEALDTLRAEVGAGHLSEDSFDSDVETAELMAALETPSLLGDMRMVIVQDADSLKKEQAEAIERYLTSPSPHAILVLVAAGKTKLDKTIKTMGSIVTLDTPKGRRLVGWLRQRGGEHGLKLDERAGGALLDSIGTELRDLDAALTQLATQHGDGAKIGAAQVRDAFSRLADQRIFAFTDAVGDRRLPVAMGSLRRLLEQGDEPLVLLGSLTAQVRRMLRARRYVDQGPKAVGDALGLPGWRAERLQKQAKSYREEELVTAMEVLAATDVEIKGGDLTPEAALERAVIQIITGAVPTPMF
jgi:DNA polymerase III subunit delta